MLFGSMFICGSFFAVTAWILIPSPIGIFQPEYHYTSHDVTVSLLGCGLSLTGYFLWMNWFLFAIHGKFIPKSGVLIQVISFGNHLGWLLFFPLLRETNFVEFLTNLPLVVL